MDFIFSDYPEHPWFSEWTIEPRNCSSTHRKNSPGHLFQTTETVGRLSPQGAEPEWTLGLPVSEKGRAIILFNGLCLYPEKKNAPATEVLCPEPGVLWGRSSNLSKVALLSDSAIRQEGGLFWLESDKTSALLLRQDDVFCLVCKSHYRDEALRIAESYLERDFPAAMSHEMQLREGAKQLFEEMLHHDSLAAISAESMMKALRPAEGSIPMAWSQSSSTDQPMLDVNEIHPLALAWRLLDIETAEELLLCVLKLQTNAGAIPVHYHPHATHSVLEAPKPMLAKSVETVWQERKSERFLDAALPLLRRHVQWMLHHFDPKRRGLHCWRSSSEPITSERFDPELATVDLAVLLITEIDALNRLLSQQPAEPPADELFETERKNLEHNILEQFWSEEEQAFSIGILRDKPVKAGGLAQVAPLIWKDLPHTRKTAILERMRQSGKLPGGLSMFSWRKSAMDDNSFPLLQQLMVFQALQTADPHGELISGFSRITLQGFVEWHDLSLKKESRLSINAETAAYIMAVQAMRQYRYHAKGAVTGRLFKTLRKVKADRFDLAVIALTIFTAFSVHLIYSVLHSPPPLELLETQMNMAYANRDGLETLKNCMAIIHHYPEHDDRANLLAGNISMFNQEYETAAGFYEAVRKNHPDSPGPMIALGLAYHLQGRLEEADANYYEFAYLFDEIFPGIVLEVNRYRFTISEGLKTPPKWQEMYRYDIMHQL